MERVTKGLLILAIALTATRAEGGRDVPKEDQVYNPQSFLLLHWLKHGGGIFPGFGPGFGGHGGPGGGIFPGFGKPGDGFFPGGGLGKPGGGFFPGGGLGGPGGLFPGFGGKGRYFPSKSLEVESAARWGNEGPGNDP